MAVFNSVLSSRVLQKWVLYNPVKAFIMEMAALLEGIGPRIKRNGQAIRIEGGNRYDHQYQSKEPTEATD